MAFASPLVLTINAVAKSLAKINQDNYGSEYYLRESTGDYRVKIRHSTDKAVVGTGQVHRSNVTVVQTVFSTVAGVPDESYEISMTVRNGKGADATKVGYLGSALSALMVQARFEDLVGWLN